MNNPTQPPTVSRQRRYTDEDAIQALAVLAEQGGNVAATSRATGIPEQTLRDWRDGNVYVPPPEVVAKRKRAQAETWDDLQSAGVARALEKLSSASARDAAVIAGIAADKAAQLRGEGPGSGPAVVVNVNAVSVSLTPDDIAAARALLANCAPLSVTTGTMPHSPQDEPG
jgi:transposase-like protein